MKLSKVAAAVAALLATDAKPTEAQIMAAVIAADKKGKDENTGLGPKELDKKAGDEKDDDKDEKAKDAKDPDDPEGTNDEFPDKKDDKAKDKKGKDGDPDVEGMDDIQPAKTATGNSGAGGAEPAKDKKATDAAIRIALDARDALHAARRDVEPVLGVVAYDSAAEVYKAALTKLGVTVDGVHASAYPTLYKMAREKVDALTPVFASDSARVNGMASAIKGYDRLR